MMPPNPSAPRGRVLLVEDDEAIQRVVVETLAEAGYGVVTAPDGAAALALVGPPGDCRPDLILLDVAMPVMDGPAFAEAYARTPGPHAPIIVLTASSGVDAADWTEQVCATGFLLKPFDLDALLAMVHRHARAT